MAKSKFVEQREVTLADGSTGTVDLFARDGAIGIATLTDSGEQHFVELGRVRTHRNQDKNGRFRWYDDFRLPDRLGGRIVTVRLHAAEDDERRKFTTGPRTYARSQQQIRTSTACTGGATMPSRSTVRSMTRCGCVVPIRSVTPAST